MNREEAAAVLDAMIFGAYPDDDITIEKIEMEAVRFAIAAMRGLGWVRTADRLPTEADAGVDEKILTIYDDGETRVMGTDYWAYVAMVPEVFPYWTPVPKLPEVEE